MQDQVALSLATMCEGAVEEQFQRLYRSIVPQLQKGQTGKISVEFTFERIQDAETLVKVSYKITPKFPAISKTSLCQVTGDNRLKTDAPTPKPKVVGLFDRQEGGNVNE